MYVTLSCSCYFLSLVGSVNGPGALQYKCTTRPTNSIIRHRAFFCSSSIHPSYHTAMLLFLLLWPPHLLDAQRKVNDAHHTHGINGRKVKVGHSRPSFQLSFLYSSSFLSNRVGRQTWMYGSPPYY